MGCLGGVSIPPTDIQLSLEINGKEKSHQNEGRDNDVRWSVTCQVRRLRATPTDVGVRHLKIGYGIRFGFGEDPGLQHFEQIQRSIYSLKKSTWNTS